MTNVTNISVGIGDDGDLRIHFKVNGFDISRCVEFNHAGDIIVDQTDYCDNWNDEVRDEIERYLSVLNKNIISFGGKGDLGEYGIHDGFFNAIATIDGVKYNFQCCVNNDGSINFSDCGYNDGVCGDVNEKLSVLVGWDGVLAILKKAYGIFIMEI